MRTIKEITTKHRQNGNKLFYIGRKEQGIEETVKNRFREKSVQFRKQIKTTPLMETEAEEKYYIHDPVFDGFWSIIRQICRI